MPYGGTEAAEQWLAERVNTTHRRAFIIEGYVRRAVLPVLGSYRLRDVMPAEIGKMVRDYRDEAGKTSRAKTSGRSAARALLATCEGLFAHAVANGWIDSSPAEQLPTNDHGHVGTVNTERISTRGHQRIATNCHLIY